MLTDGVAEPKVDYTTELGLIAEKEKIAEGGEYNLSGERYRESSTRLSHFPIVSLSEMAEVVAGQSPPGKSYNDSALECRSIRGKPSSAKCSLVSLQNGLLTRKGSPRAMIF